MNKKELEFFRNEIRHGLAVDYQIQGEERAHRETRNELNKLKRDQKEWAAKMVKDVQAGGNVNKLLQLLSVGELPLPVVLTALTAWLSGGDIELSEQGLTVKEYVPDA
ncbi:MAG: hypothetical protein K2W95_00960 [Candidatus Obscuribacterales bacterium]|nr:hypothetical protein [Candidatus Obscuribacterales bacterium]